MEQRLIDADALKESIGCADAVKYGNKTAEQRNNSYSTMMMYEIADYIDDMPTVDAEPVVRCKDCVYLTKDRISAYVYGFCQKHDTCIYSEDFFCAYGMRRNACG